MGIKNVSFRVVIMVIACAILVSCACGKDYRKVLEKKGIPFTQESFLKEVRAGSREHVELFIKAGMDINTGDKDGSSALMIASEKGFFEMAELLIKSGADVNAKNMDGYTALMYAAYKGNLQIAELLIDNKADVNARDKDGWTALRYASIQGQHDIVAILRKAKDKK
jgi:ankyrin repeat protein